MAVFDAVNNANTSVFMWKAMFSDFTQYGAYTRVAKRDIFILWGAQLLSGEYSANLIKIGL